MPNRAVWRLAAFWCAKCRVSRCVGPFGDLSVGRSTWSKSRTPSYLQKSGWGSFRSRRESIGQYVYLAKARDRLEPRGRPRRIAAPRSFLESEQPDADGYAPKRSIPADKSHSDTCAGIRLLD